MVRIAAALLPLLDDNGTAYLFNQAMIQNGTLTREQLQMLSLEEDCTCNVYLQHLRRAESETHQAEKSSDGLDFCVSPSLLTAE